MSHPLERKIGTLRARLRRLLAVYGASRVVATVLAAVIALGVADFLIRFQDPGIRLIASMVVFGAVGWTCYRYVYLLLGTRLGDVELARRVQRRFPTLGDGLASAVEFLRQSEDDPTAGSVALRRTVIARATADTERLDFSDVVCRGPTLRAAATAVGVGLVAALLIILDPLSSGIAVARLANPFGHSAWHHLVLYEEVTKVARGEAFEVEVVDAEGRELPSKVYIHYRFEDPGGSFTEETELMTFVDGSTAATRRDGTVDLLRAAGVMVAGRPNVTRPFSYRVSGGDDASMPWIPVEVIEPAAAEELSVELIPPEYTGWPTERSQGDIRALVGTQVKISARSTKPLKKASFCLGLEEVHKIPAQLAPDGRSFTVGIEPSPPLVIDTPGNYDYWFELTDLEGPHAGANTRWEIRASADSPPSVTIEQPNTTVYVTPGADLPLVIAAKDDLAVHDISLRFGRSDRPDDRKVEETVDPGPDRAMQRAEGFSKQLASGDSRLIQYVWKLGPLALTPSTRVTFEATAGDYLPQHGVSESCELIVITPQELIDRIASRQAFILTELARVLEMQRQSRDQTTAIEIQVGEIGHLDQLGLDHLRGAELNQRQVTHTLTSTSDGVPMHVARLLDDLDTNKVDSPDVRRQMEQLLSQIDGLRSGPLPVIGRELTASIKAATVELQERSPDEEPSGQDVAGPLASAGRQQDEVIASLQRLLGQLSRWDDFRRFHRDVGQLHRDQEALLARTTELARRTLGKAPKDLVPQEAADLKIAGRDQFEIARRLDGIQHRMQQAVDQLQDSDPLAAETVADALDSARRLAIDATMRAAAGDAVRNQMGQAIGRQKQVIEDLLEVLDVLANRREHELARLIKKLREAEADLAEMAARQENLQDQFEQAAAEPDDETRRRRLERLGKEQEALQEDAERIERRLERLMADQAAQSAGQAAEKMSEAGQCASQGGCQEASQKAAEAKQKLEEARDQLAQRRRDAEFQLAVEQLAKLEDTLKAMHTRQQNALKETERLDLLGSGPAGLTAAQTVSLRQLAGEQGLLHAQLAALLEQLGGAQVFKLALSSAADDMNRATGLLNRGQTGRPTQQLQTGALAGLAQVLEALRPEPPEEDPEGAGGGQGGQGPQSGTPPGDAIRVMAELKLLKLMQEDINSRTRLLEEEFGALTDLTRAAQARYDELSRRQGLLADLLLNLVPVGQDTEDDPDALPDLGPDAADRPTLRLNTEETP